MKLSKNITTGREKEARMIKQSNCAVAVARLMQNKIQNWEEFLEPSTIDYAGLPRKQLKSGNYDIKKRLKSELNSFFKKNFQGFTEKKLAKLYEDIKANRGLEMPLKDFGNKYGKVNPAVLKGNPTHLTVYISLWGLQFLFPEDLLSKDIITALSILQASEKKLLPFENKLHKELSPKKDVIAEEVRKKEFAQRTLILACFNLIESFLNGIAWDYCQKKDISRLSQKKQKLLTDTFSVSIRDKLLKYPKLISNDEEGEADHSIELFLEIIKPFRDSLVHPSPFSAPEKFGGYDKLRKIYDLNQDVAKQAILLLIDIISKICKQIYAGNEPIWFKEFKIKAKAKI